MVGWIFAGLCGLLLCLLSLPVVLQAEYNGELTVWVRYFFLRYQVFPRPPGEEKPPEEKKPKPPQEEKPKKPQKEKPSAGELFALGKELLEGLWPPVRWLLKTVVFYDIFFGMRVAEDDAAQTAISCGRYNAAAFGICSFPENLFQLKRVKISVFPDFTQEESAVCFRGKVRMIPLAALAAGLAILAALLVKLLPLFLRKEKKEEPHEPEESTQQNKGGVTI